jgi:Glycosyl hydrolase catalytic core
LVEESLSRGQHYKSLGWSDTIFQQTSHPILSILSIHQFYLQSQEKMSFKTVALLALAATVLAHPKRHHHHHHNGTGTDAGFMVPTGEPFSAPSTTALPASSINAAVDFFAAGPATTTPCTSSSTVTTVVTSVQYYSVTVTAANLAVANYFPPPGPYSVPTTFSTSLLQTTGAGVSTTISSSIPSSAASTAPAAPPPPSTGSNGPKGLSYNVASLTDAFAGLGMTWAYNWGATPDGTITPGLEYVPMLWGQKTLSGWSSAAAAAISSGSSHLLSINEPDLSTQANMSPSDAAAFHIANMNPFAGQAQIGSPAVTNGVGSSPPIGITWLQQFFAACNNNCKVDFVAFHYYNDASQIDDFKSHVADVISTAAANGVSTVWLTEFGASGSDADVESFLSEALTFLDGQSAVERYAYFMCGDGTLLSGTSLSALGQVYAS